MTPWKARLGDGISAAFALCKAPVSARVLMYHSVGGAACGDKYGIYSIDPTLFTNHVEHLRAMDMRVKRFEDVVSSASDYAVTFDDGYRDNLTCAAPLLANIGLPFTVFVATDFVARNERGFLAREELKELARLPGVTVGAHGRTHRRLTECNDAELADELQTSRAWLEDLLGRRVTIMSYPHGAVDARVHSAVAQAGYTAAACSRFGSHHVGGDPLRVPRVDVWGIDEMPRFEAKIRGHWDWMGWRL